MNNSDSTFRIGRYDVNRGVYGPGPLDVIEQFRMIEPSAQPIKVGSGLFALLMIGAIEPKQKEDFDIIRKGIADLQAKLPEGEAVSMEDIEAEPELPDNVSKELVEVLSLAIGDFGKDGDDARERILSLFPQEEFETASVETLPDPPGDVKFPKHGEMRKQLEENVEGWRDFLQEDLPNPRKEDLQRVYYAYRKGLIS